MELKTIKKKYEANGFVVLKNFISKTEMKKAKKQLLLFSKKYKSKKKRNINYTNKKINSIHDMDSWNWIKELKKRKNLKKLVSNLMNCKPKNFGSEFFAKPALIGLKSPAHQDNFYWSINNQKGLTIWISFNKADRSNGGVYYYSGSHKLGLLKHKPSFAPGSSQTISNKKKLKKLEKKVPSLNIGDCIIHNCMVVHGSTKNTSKISREGVTLRFIPNNSKIDYSHKKKYESQLRLQIKKREK